MTTPQKQTVVAIPPPPVAKPPDPQMGKCEETYKGSKKYYYVFGGKPEPDWSGLQGNQNRSVSDLCYRTLDPVAGQKGTVIRTKGLSKEYESKASLTDFLSDIWEHLVKFGLDTIAYLPDPRDPNKVLNAVKQHAQFTGDMHLTEQHCNDILSKFDKWDRKNDTEAKDFLFDSLSETVKTGFKHFHNKETESFALTWLRFVHYLVTSNSKNFDKVKTAIRNIKPQQFEGQNIEKMSTQYIEKSEELVNSGYFDYSLVLNIVDGFLCASKDSKGTFHHNMNELRSKIEKVGQTTVFMSKIQQEEQYAKAGITVKDVCYEAVKQYKALADENLWEPKKLPKDRHTPSTQDVNMAAINSAFNLIANMSGQSQQQVSNKTDQTEHVNKGGKGYKSKRGCYNCGSTDHLRKDCPLPAKTPDERKRERHKSIAPWRLKAPSNGEKQTKTVNGRTYHWCAKCENWTTTHSTQSHGKPFNKSGSKFNNNKKKKTKFTPETNLTSFEPAAWLVQAEVQLQEPRTLEIFKYLYFVLTVPILLGFPLPTFVTLLDAYNQSNNLLSVIMTTLKNITSTLAPIMAVSIGPLFWITLGVLVCKMPQWYTQPFHPIADQETPRALRRLSLSPRPSRPRSRVKSAREHQLHRTYPLRLRKDNVYNIRSSTPTCKQRKLQASLDSWITTETPSQQHASFSSRHENHFHKSKGGYENKGGFRNKGGHGNQRKPRKHYKQNPHDKKSQYATDFRNGYFSPNDSPPAQQSYVPVGLQTNRDSPNRNLTTRQYKRLKDKAKAIFLTDSNIDKESKELATNISLLAPSRFRASMAISKESSQFPIVWDSGASICVTPERSDFTTYTSTTDVKEVKGVGGISSSVIGQGEVKWAVYDVNGALRTFTLQAYHIPSSKTRLISTSSLLRAYRGEHITINENSLKLSGIKNDPTRSQVMVFNNPVTHLPTTTAYLPADTGIPERELYNTVATVSENNHNLSESQKELLRWHQRLGHLDFNKIKHLLRTGVLSHTEGTRSLHTAASKLTEVPKCAACLFGKQVARSPSGVITKVVRDRAGVLRAGNLMPGQEISVDHFVSSVRGRLFKGYNKGSLEDRYMGGCIFVDHASGYIHVEFQSSLSSHETLNAKLNFERECRDVGVVPQTYMSDNGSSFTSREFTDHLTKFFQISKFAGVGAHHHNTQAERAIRTIMSIARTMMIHSGIYWPDVATSTLWPMAVKHACHLFNHVPNHTTGLSPTDIFTRTRWPQKKFLDMHVWGCPVYVLEKSLQDGKKIPKWKPRSNRSMYMGVSPYHASTVPLVLSTGTGAITPQFHVVFDDWFATIGSDHTDLPNFQSNEWYKMFGESRYQYVEDTQVEEDEYSQDLVDALKNELRSNKIAKEMDKHDSPSPLDVPEPAVIKEKSDSQRHKTGENVETKVPDTPIRIETEAKTPEKTPMILEEDTNTEPVSNLKPKKIKKGIERLDLGPRMSTRRSRRNPVQRLTYTHDKSSLVKDAKIMNIMDISTSYMTDGDVHIYHLTPDYHVMISSSKEANPDLFGYDEAMNSEHRSSWIQSAIKEITQLERLDCWEEVPIEAATTKVLPGTWVFKVKRSPDGTFKKFKARYCIRGDLQEGDFETYAPVVQFSSVRLFLAWSLMLGWYTCSIDFSNAFIQATLHDPTFIHLPRGFRASSGGKTCLRLKKSLYGLSVAPRLWYQHLWKALKKLGLQQSKHDACLLLRKDLIVICYVDDLGIQAPTKEIVDELITKLEEEGFDLTHEGSFSEYLGIKYSKIGENEIKMTQEGLIKKILDATGMTDCNTNRTPTTKEALSMDEEGERMEDNWNYRSVIGMMLYLATNTRPDIAFGVSQVARFSHNPKKSHASAVKTLIRYLAGTIDQGVIYKRPQELCLDCFVDADFAGLFGRDPPESPSSVKSRTGYIISVGGCYILCKSQLQSTIALSTSEAEYGALSQAMRAVIPIRETLLEMIKVVEMVDTNGTYPFGMKDRLVKFQTVIHEDNSAALSLAVKQKVTSRTKHWCVKFHFFWSYVNNEKNNTKCVRVGTKEQKADYLTKGLTKDTFEQCRRMNQGW